MVIKLNIAKAADKHKHPPHSCPSAVIWCFVPANLVNFDPLTPKGDQHLISPYFNIAELKIKIMRNRKRSPSKEAVIVNLILLVSCKGNV